MAIIIVGVWVRHARGFWIQHERMAAGHRGSAQPNASSGFTYGYQACKVSLDGNGDSFLHGGMTLFICSTLLLSSLHMIQVLPKSIHASHYSHPLWVYIFTPTKQKKTYNSGDSPVVTHLTTSPPVHRLSTAERTGCAVRRCPMVVCGSFGQWWCI
jgi:hypothetical protein